VEANQVCRLCDEQDRLQRVYGADSRIYFLCRQCMLISVDSRYFLSNDEERARYETHNNMIENKGYVEFLNRVIQPMLKYIQPGMAGVDYGCGPGPILSQLVHQAGIECDDYDPIFYPKPLSDRYDFVFSTETFEHFFYPKREIEKLSALISPGGYLGVMTGMWDSIERFKTWYYTRDPTHVSFFHRDTLDYMCKTFGFTELYTSDKRVIILQKTFEK